MHFRVIHNQKTTTTALFKIIPLLSVSVLDKSSESFVSCGRPSLFKAIAVQHESCNGGHRRGQEERQCIDFTPGMEAKQGPTVAACDVFHYSLRHISFQFKRGWGAKGEWISHRIMMNSELVYFSKYCLPDIKYFYNTVNITEIRLQVCSKQYYFQRRKRCYI